MWFNLAKVLGVGVRGLTGQIRRNKKSKPSWQQGGEKSWTGRSKRAAGSVKAGGGGVNHNQL